MGDPQHEVQVGGAIRSGALYLEREADGALLEVLGRGSIAYVLAPRQMGKTSLIRRTRATLHERGARTAVADLSGLGLEVRDPDAWYLALADELAVELELPDPESELHSRPDTPMPVRFGHWLRSVVAADPRPLVVFLDELDALLRNPALASELLALLRSLWERDDSPRPKLTFCLSGVVAPWQLGPARHTDGEGADTTPFNVGHEVVLQDFSREELTPLEGAIDAAPGDRSLILDAVAAFTSGHPFMTARLVRALPRPAQISDVERCATQLYLEGAGDVTLTASERAFLAGPSELLDVYAAALRDGSARPPSPETMREAQLTGMLARGAGGLVPRNAIYRRVFDAIWLARCTRGRRFGEAVERWVAGGREDVDLLRGAALAELQAWAEEARLTADEQALLLASVERARREAVATTEATARRRSQRWMTVGLVVLSVALVAMVIALRGERDALSRAEALRNASQAELLLSAPKRAREALRAAVESTGFRDDAGEPLPESQHALAVAVDTLAGRVFEGPDGPLVAVGCSPDGRHAATRSGDGTVIRWALADGTRSVLGSAPGWLPDVNVLPHGEVHARSALVDVAADAVGESGNIQLTRASTGTPIGRLSGVHSEAMMALRFDPRGDTLLSVADDDTAVLWSVPRLRMLRRYGALPTTPRAGAFCGAGSRALLVGDDGALHVWALHGAALASRRAPDGGGVSWAGWDADGALWMSSSRGSVFRRPAGARRFERRAEELGEHGWVVLGPGVALASDENGATRLLRPRGDTPVAGWARRRDRAFTPDGRTAVLMRGEEAVAIDIGTGAVVGRFAPRAARLETASLSPDGRWVATGDVEGGLVVWDLSGERRWEAHHGPGPIYSAVWSPDGRLLVTHGRVDEPRVWDAATGRLRARLVGHRGTTNLARFSADGRRVITTGYADNTAQIWRVDDGTRVALLEGHRARVRVADLDPSGRVAVTAGDDGTVRVWDAETGAPLATFGGLDGPVRHLQIAPSGDRVLTVCDDGWLRIHPLGWRPLLRRACTMLGDVSDSAEALPLPCRALSSPGGVAAAE